MVKVIGGAEKYPDTVNSAAGPSGVSKHSGEPIQKSHLKLKDIRQLVGDSEQEHVAVEINTVGAVGTNAGDEAINPVGNMEVQQARNVQAQANLAESVVIIDPIPDRDGKSKEDEEVLQLLKKQLAPWKDDVYSPEVRRLAESLAEMFPNTSLSYLLHRCTFKMFHKCKQQEFCILYSS